MTTFTKPRSNLVDLQSILRLPPYGGEIGVTSPKVMHYPG